MGEGKFKSRLNFVALRNVVLYGHDNKKQTAKVFTKRKPSQVTVRLSDYPTDRLVDILNEQNKAREEEHE